MRKIKKLFLIIFLLLATCFLTSCNKTTYEIIIPYGEINVNDFSLSDYKLHIKNKHIDTTVDVTSDMLDSSDLEKLKTTGSHDIIVRFKSFKEKITIKLTGFAQYFDMEYYKDANGKYGEDLKLALRRIISYTIKTETYDDLREDLQKTDKGKTNGTIICFYCHKEMDAKWDNGKTWNREHVWPQSLGWFSTTMAGADLHHLRPCHQSENSSRGNTPYGESAGYYVPNDDVKGDIARILFYMYTRYEEADRYSLNTVCESFDILLTWNKIDPVDEIELQRNEVAYSIQGNRNPFIDYSLYADLIWG